jgi:hypothetical protein
LLDHQRNGIEIPGDCGKSGKGDDSSTGNSTKGTERSRLTEIAIDTGKHGGSSSHFDRHIVVDVWFDRPRNNETTIDIRGLSGGVIADGRPALRNVTEDTAQLGDNLGRRRWSRGCRGRRDLIAITIEARGFTTGVVVVLGGLGKEVPLLLVSCEEIGIDLVI